MLDNFQPLVCYHYLLLLFFLTAAVAANVLAEENAEPRFMGTGRYSCTGHKCW